MVVFIQGSLYLAVGFFRLRVWGNELKVSGVTQTFQNPLIKEYTLNHIRDPIII